MRSWRRSSPEPGPRRGYRYAVEAELKAAFPFSRAKLEWRERITVLSRLAWRFDGIEGVEIVVFDTIDGCAFVGLGIARLGLGIIFNFVIECKIFYFLLRAGY